MTDVLRDIDVVCFFVVFGSLIEITDRRRPFAHLKRKMTSEKALKFRHMAMTTELTLPAIDAEIEGGRRGFLAAGLECPRDIASGFPQRVDHIGHPHELLSNLVFEWRRSCCDLAGFGFNSVLNLTPVMALAR